MSALTRRPRVRVSRAYERRRLRLVGEEAGAGAILDIGHAHWPNTYLRGEIVGFDREVPASPSGYAEDLQGSVEDLPGALDGRTFDAVIAAELIEHLEEPYAFLKSIRSLIRPGGRLVLSTPNPVGLPVLFFEILRSRRFFYARDHSFYFTPRWVYRMLEDSGYRVAGCRGVGLWTPVGAVPGPIGLSYQVIYVAEPAEDAPPMDQ